MIFTPRVLGVIWGHFNPYGLFMDNPDAPSEAVFQAHYAGPNPNLLFSWSDQSRGITYLYDLSINQVQVTPELEPYARWVNEINKPLWKIVSPALLEVTDGDWKKVWFDAARKLNLAAMWFIIEQGFDVNTPDEQGFPALFHAIGPYGGSIDVVRLLVESGADLTRPNSTVDFLIKAGREGVTSAGEANEAMAIAYYLRKVTNAG